MLSLNILCWLCEFDQGKIFKWLNAWLVEVPYKRAEGTVFEMEFGLNITIITLNCCFN